MKCRYCGANLDDGVLFCGECGAMVNPQKRFCRECGKEIPPNAHFCSYCGADLTTTPAPEELENKPTSESRGAAGDKIKGDTPLPSTGPDIHTDMRGKITAFLKEIQAKLMAFWVELDSFSKVFAISSAVILVLLLIAWTSHNGTAVFISLLQLTALVLSILWHREILNCPKAWLKYAVLAVALLFSILNITSYSSKKENTPKASIGTTVAAENTESTIFPPCAATDCIGQSCDTVKNAFSAAGFTEVHTVEINDLPYSESNKNNTVESISVGGKNSFSKALRFNSSDVVEIRYHTYKKFSINVDVDFISNLFFDKYGIALYFNEEKVGELAHGEDKSFSLKAKPGTYALVFQKKGDTSCTGSLELDIKGDVNAAVQISCQSDSILVKPLYIEKLGEVHEGEIMMPQAASSFQYEDYTEVQSTLESTGFINISTAPVYDIVWGWTGEGETASVSIDGNANFVRGDIFSASAPVVITYHMKEENDPNRVTEATKSPETVKPMETDKTYSIDDDFLVIKCDRDEKYQTMYHIAFAQIDANGDYILEYSFGHCVNPRAMGSQFNAIGSLPSWFYVGATVHLRANLGYDGLSETDTTVTESSSPNGSAEATELTTTVVLPEASSKLGKDFDSQYSSTVYYLNVDGIKNKPTITTWKGATVTDGVAEYLTKLESDGFTIRITNQNSKTPYVGFTYYETYFDVSKPRLSWTMYLEIQSEKYVEYELDIHLN